MKNKRFLFTSLILIFFSSIIFSQKKDSEQNNNHKNINDTASFEKAKKSIYDGHWVFEASKNSNANAQHLGDVLMYYIINEGDSCNYKLDLTLSTSLMPDPTQIKYLKGKCKAAIISVKEDKRGHIRQKIYLNGENLKANVDITLLGSGNSAIADIYPLRAKGAKMVRYSGKIIPFSESELSKNK